MREPELNLHHLSIKRTKNVYFGSLAKAIDLNRSLLQRNSL